jgi:hypothetical protein
VQQLLQIPSSSVLSAAPYFQNKTKRQKACQIDLLIQCRYSIYLCEIKFGQKIFPEVIDEVSEKIGKLAIPKGVSVRPILIYQGELSPKIERADFFSHLISFEQFLQSPT